ncbi:MAG: YicC family protein [Treponema sp.]|nr:YicC family protein [Treponema sp.]
MNSMTGYGYKEAVIESTQVSVEIRSVNSRFLDLSINLPQFLNVLESRIRKTICSKIIRGKVDVYIRVKDLESSAKIVADTKAAVRYRDAIASVAQAVGQSASDIPLSLIIEQEGVLNVTYEYDPESYWKKIEPVFEEVLNGFVSDRIREGENLKADLLNKLDVLDSCAAFFKEWQPKMEAKFRETIEKKFHELLGEHVDQNKILEETAAMLVRYTINEEIIRLQSHLSALRKEFVENPTPGKRIDFICQEANREINTIGSKNQFTEVGQAVVNAKDALEIIREQSKNVE